MNSQPTPQQAVIMAAGRGKRLRPLTDRLPKPMVRVGGRPILEWSIEALPPEVREVVLVVGYMGEVVREHFGDEFDGRRLLYVEQKELKGTGHVVHMVAPVLEQRFLILNGDDLYSPADLDRLCSHELGLLGLRVEDNGRFGLLSVTADGHLSDLSDDRPQGAGGVINIGAYMLDRQFLDYDLVPIGDGSEFGLPQTLGVMSRDRRVKVVEGTAWLPIGFPEDVPLADKWVSRHREPKVTAAA
ncbi:NDP-sugar synthase [Patescibacteria group bacterium]